MCLHAQIDRYRCAYMHNHADIPALSLGTTCTAFFTLSPWAGTATFFFTTTGAVTATTTGLSVLAGAATAAALSSGDLRALSAFTSVLLKLPCRSVLRGGCEERKRGSDVYIYSCLSLTLKCGVGGGRRGDYVYILLSVSYSVLRGA